jgi:DHA1 family tetracycline resistance protein-like MFS transporter
MAQICNPSSSAETADNRGSRRALVLMFFTVFIDLVGFGIVIPVLPLYAKQFGASGFTVGLLLMSYSAMQLFFAPMWGRLSDRIGRRPVLIISLSASVAGYSLWGFAGSLSMLFLSRLVAGLGNANLAVAQAYISDITPAESRSRAMGLIGAAFGLGFVLGPAISGIAMNLGMPANLLGFLAASFSIIDLVFTAVFLPEPAGRTDSAHQRFSNDRSFYIRTLTNKTFLLPLLIMFISTFAFANMETTLVLLTNQYFKFDMVQNSYLFAGLGLVMVFVQGGLIRPLSKRVPDKLLVTTGCALITLGLLLAPASHSIVILCFALLLLASGSGINNPSNSSLLSKLSAKHETGGVMGIGQSASTLGRIIGPVTGGLLFDLFGPTVPYWAAAVCTFIACMLSLRLPRENVIR